MLPLMLAVAALADLPRPMPDGFALPPQAIHRFGNRLFRHPDAITALAVSPDGKLVATLSPRCLVVWDAATGVARQVITSTARYSFNPAAVEFVNGSGSVLCNVVLETGDDIGTHREFARVYDVATGNLAYSLTIFIDRPVPYARAADNGRLVVADVESHFHHHDAKTGRYHRRVERKVFRWHADEDRNMTPVLDLVTGEARTYLHRQVDLLAESPDRRLIAWGRRHDQVHIRDLATRRPDFTLDFSSGNPLRYLTVSRDNKSLYGWTWDELVKWDLETNRPARSVRSSREIDGPTALSPDERLIYTGVGSRVVRYDTGTGRELPSPDGSHEGTPSVALADRGRRLMVADTSGTIRFHDLATGRPADRWDLGPATKAATAVASPDGKHVAVSLLARRIAPHGRWPGVAFWSPRIRLVDRVTGRVVWEREKLYGRECGLEPYAPQSRLWFDRDGSVLLSGGYAGVIVHGTGSGVELGQTYGTWVFAADPGLTWFAGRSVFESSSTWCLFDPLTGETMRRVSAEPAASVGVDRLGPASTSDLVASPDGRDLITAQHDGTVRWWDPRTGKESHRRRPTLDEGMTLAVSDDGRYLAIAGERNPEVFVWEMSSRKPVLTLTGNLTASTQLLFTRDGRGLVTNADMAPTLWSLRTTRRVDASIDDLWKRLASTDAAEAYAAQWSLVARPSEAVKLFADRVTVSDLVLTRAMFDAWVADLDSPRFAVREAAQKSLSSAAPRIPAAWLEAPASTASEEARSRIGRVRSQPEHPDHWRLIRAATVLKWIDTPESTALLKRWTDAADWLK